MRRGSARRMQTLAAAAGVRLCDCHVLGAKDAMPCVGVALMSAGFSSVAAVFRVSVP